MIVRKNLGIFVINFYEIIKVYIINNGKKVISLFV